MHVVMRARAGENKKWKERQKRKNENGLKKKPFWNLCTAFLPFICLSPPVRLNIIETATKGQQSIVSISFLSSKSPNTVSAAIEG